MSTFRDLIIWQKAVAMVTDVYVLTKSFPQEEIYGLTSQIRRCAISIPSNIAEGYGRPRKPDHTRFLDIAMGSLFELQTQFQISRNLNYIDQSRFDKLFDDSREIERMLCSYMRTIKNR